MAGYTIGSAPSGENTAPDGTEKIPLSGSKFIQILNLVTRKLRETSGPAVLSMGAVADGEYLKRDGSSIVGATVTGGSGGTNIEGSMYNGYISVSVASNNITVAIKTLAGADPSAGDPVKVRIGNVERSITAALSVTKNAGTNWFNSGSTELATKEIDYFVYLIWNTTPATDIVDVGFARISYAQLYSDFSGTTTAITYLASGNASAPTSTDNVVLIGRFAATLSATASFNWSVPTFTHANLIQYPITKTRVLTWVPAHFSGGANYTNAPTTNKAYYMIDGYFCEIETAFTYNATSGGSSYSRLTLPFTPADSAIALSCLNATSGAGGQAQTENGYLYCYKYDGTTPIVNSNKIGINGKFRII